MLNPPQRQTKRTESAYKKFKEWNKAFVNTKRKHNKIYRKKEFDLLKPITEKAKNAILKVGQAQGYDYVLDASQGQGVIFAGGKDLLQDVKSELGF